MSEVIRHSAKVPRLNLPDRGQEKQYPVNVVTHHTSGKSYRIPLLALSRIVCFDDSTFGSRHREDEPTDSATGLTTILPAADSAETDSANSLHKDVLISQAVDIIDSDRNLITTNRSSTASKRYFLISL